MSKEHQSEALQLSDQLQEMIYGTCHNAAIELRRLAPFEAWYEESVDEINRLRAQVQALSSGNERQASKIEKLAGDLKAREADICKDRASLRVIYDYQRGERWYWQGDGQDHLDSMADLLPIVIRAEQLRALIAKPTHSLPTRPVVPKECAPTDCDAWFASLPQGRQWALREDKWTLARAAFDAGRAAAPQAEAPVNSVSLKELNEIKDLAKAQKGGA